jgi:hypothetical protein
MKTYYKEETILNPLETSFRTEAWIIDAKHINSMNHYGEFGITFCPLTSTHHQMLHEHLESCVSQVKMMTNPDYSNKEARPLYEDKMGHFYSSQLFTPKVNTDFYHSDELYGKTATITGHARDLPTGEVVINIDYVDIDCPNNGIEPTELEEETTGTLVDDNDDW